MRYAKHAVVGVVVGMLVGFAVHAGPVEDFLAAAPRIAAQIRLETGVPGAFLAYERWSQEWKDRLEEMVAAYRAGEALPFPTPVALADSGTVYPTAAGYASLELGRDVYFAQIGHMLYLEIEGLLPWSLAGYTDTELAALFPSSNFFVLQEYSGKLRYQTFMGPNGQDAGGILGDPRDVLGFLMEEPEEGRTLLGETQDETAANLSEWFHDFIHHWNLSSPESPADFYQRYPYFSDRLRRLPVETLGDVRVAIVGCWSASALYATLMRTVNIPAQTIIVSLVDGMGQAGEHAGLRVSIGGEARYLPHTDDLYTGWGMGANPLTPWMSVGWALWWNVWLDEATFFSISARHLDANILARFSYEALDRYQTEASWNMATYGSIVSVCSYRGLSGCEWSAMGDAVMLGLQDQKSLTIDEARGWWMSMQDVLAYYGSDPCEACDGVMEAQLAWCERTRRCDKTGWPDR